MAGRDISVTHIALASVRVMRTCAMMGEVVGLAAKVCTDHNCMPRDLWPTHFGDLKVLMQKGAGNPDAPNLQMTNVGRNAHHFFEKPQTVKDTPEHEVKDADWQFEIGGSKLEMVLVEGGSFDMGADGRAEFTHEDEKPVHRVQLDSYYIGRYEVTNALWKAVMGAEAGIKTKSEEDRLPVQRRTRTEIKAFCDKLGELTGKSFRLPTEAEWEYAARGGNKSKGYKYSGSNKVDDVAWYEDNSSKNTHAVKTKQPNELGIYDMSGNVWEWCNDWYGSYNSNAQTNPTGPASGSYRVDRGGSWFDYAMDGRVSYRSAYSAPDEGFSNSGLRLAL